MVCKWHASQEALDADKDINSGKCLLCTFRIKPAVRDLELIKKSAFMAVDFALKGESGLVDAMR